MKNILNRLKQVESRQSPLERAYGLVARGVPPSDWPDAELQAFCDAECKDLQSIADEALAEIVRHSKVDA